MNKINYIKNKNADSGWRRAFLWLRRKSLTLIMIVITALVLVPCAADAAIQFRSESSTKNDSASSLQVNKPAGCVDGDLLVAWFSHDDPGLTLSPPDGTWTAFALPGTENEFTSRAWWKQASSEPSTYTFTASGTNDITLIVACFYNDSGVGDWAIEDAAWSFTLASSLASGSVTGVADCLLVIGWAEDDDDMSLNTGPADMSIIGDQEITSSTGLLAYYETRGAGAVQKTCTFNGSADELSSMAAVFSWAASGATTTIGDGTSPADKDVAPDSTNNAVDAFTLVTDTEPETVTALEVTFTGTAVADVASSGVKIYDDSTGGTPNEWDAGDTLKGTASFSGTTADVTVSISVDSSATQYLVTYDIATGATESDTLQGAITDATVTNTLVNNDTTNATLTIPCESCVIELIGSWGTGLSHTKPDGANRALLFIAGAQVWGDEPTLTSVTYDGQSLTKISDVRIHTDNHGHVEIWMLDEAGIAATSGSTFVPTWNVAPSDTAYSHAFFSGVHQTNSIYMQATDSTITTTPNPITAAGLSTNNGDMVVVAAGALWQTGTYAPQNGFTEGNDQQVGDITLGTAYKAATGATETPSMTHSDASGDPYGQVIAGVVLRQVDSPAYRDGRLLGWWRYGLTHPKESGSNRLLVFVAVAEDWGSTRTLSSVTYGGQSLSYVDSVSCDLEYGVDNNGTLEIWILDEAGIAAASGDTFTPTWSGDFDREIYSSAFFAEVDQTTPIGAKDTNSAESPTPNPITTTGLTTNSGDMVVTAAVAGFGADKYTPQNGFTEGNDHNTLDDITLGTAYKAATGATETPSMLNSDYTSELTGQLISGVVIQASANCTFSYRKEITIQASEVIGSSDHLNYPMLVSLSGDWLKTTTADATNGRIENDPDGYDIIFRDTNLVQLDHEIESYDGSVSGGKLVAWVRIPTLYYNTDTVIYMYYGNPCIDSSTENIAGVWDDNYVGVWHLDESPANTVAGHDDSTGNPNDGTPQNFGTTSTSTTDPATDVPTWSTDSKIDGADVFDESDDYVGVGNLQSLAGSSELTMSVWFNARTLPSTSGDNYGLFIQHDDWDEQMGMRFDGSALTLNGYVETGGVTAEVEVDYSGNMVINTWYHAVLTFKDGISELFLDGVSKGTDDASSSFTTLPDLINNMSIASLNQRSTDYFGGIIDEVRVSNIARLAGWIETEHNNQKENSTFFIVGDEDDLGDCSYSFYKPITIESDEVFGISDHTDFPFLVNISTDNDLRTIANNGDIENTDGYDIIFRDSYGRQLDHEIEDYEPTTGEFVAWVRIPTLSYSTDTVIYMYYGNSCISASQENVTGVWNSNYKGVWHLKESGNGTADEYADSTGNPNHGQGGGETFESVILENSAVQDDDTAPYTLSFGFTATANRLLIAGIGTDKGSGGYTTPTGWTEIASFTNSSVGHALYYKVATGGETSVQFDWVDSGSGSAMWVGEYSGLTTTPLDKWTQANSGDTEVTSQTTGTTATTTQANEFIIASWGSDSANTIETGRSYTNSFTERAAAGNFGGSGRPAMLIADRTVSATGAYETTFNTTDSGDNLSGIIATFKIASSAGAPSQTPGRISNAQDFDGSSNYISIAAHSSLDLSTNFTVSAWFYKAIAGGENIIYASGTTNTQYWTIRSEPADKIEFNVDGTGGWESSTAIGTGAWHHMAVVKDGDAGTNMSFYVDGQPNGTATVGSVPASTGQTRAIGYRPEGPDFYWDGKLDEIRISDNPRSADWIKTCYYNQKAGSTFYSIDPEEEYSPTAVDLISFTATGQDESVLVEWETAQEIDNLGFNLYRSTDLGGTYSRLNNSLIPGLLSSVQGQQYTYVDKDVTRSVLYYYMLEDVDLKGIRTMHGPVCVDWDGDGIPDGDVEDSDDDDSDEDTDEDPEVKIPELRFDEVDFGPEGWAPSSSYASWVELSSFRARQGDEGIALEWETSFEVGNFGFHVYREVDGKFYRITPDLVPGSVFKVGAGSELPAGESYMYWDGLSEGTGHELYWLDCVELNGGRASFGPIKPEGYGQPVSERLKARFRSIGKRQVSRAQELGNIRALREELSTKPIQTQSSSATFRMNDPEKPSEPRLPPTEEQWVLSAKSGVKIYVKEDGWYRVGEPELVAAGLSPGVDPRYLQLYADGEEKSMIVTGSDDGRFDPLDVIEFYGTGLDTPFTDAHVYWLVVGSRPGWRVDTPFVDIRLDLGQRMRVPRGLRGRGAPLSFPFSLELKERTFYFAALKNGERDNFFGSVISTEPVDQLLTVAHPDPSSPEDAVLEVVLQGATDSTHQVKIMFNYVEVGELGFSRQEREAFEIQVPYDLLLEGDNIVTLTAQGGAADVSLVDKIRLTYWRKYTADEDVLQFKTSGGEWLSIGGFSSSEIQVVDITDPMRMINIRGKVMTQDSDYAITVKVPGAGERTLLAFTEDKIKSPAAIEANLASSWHETSQGAEVIIIGHSDLLESVGFLKQLREEQGWSVVLVDVEDLYDKFNFGAKSPWAMKDFLAQAYQFWNPQPSFVLLVGDTSYDPRNYLGFGEFDLVPTKFVDTGRLTTASDDWFVDFDDDGLPEMAVGRLPVESAEEAATVVSKIIAFEGVAGQMNEALLVADINDSVDFEGASADVDELLEDSMEVREILRGRSATARSDLLNLLNQGQLLVNYIGHGSTKIWNGNLLTSSDAWNLTNSPYLPFLVSMTCLNGFFQDPYSESLAEAFLKAPLGGAVAVWTSSGLTLPTEQAVMNLELIRQLSNGQGLTIGEAVMRAKRAVTNGDIRRTWILFGDPTLKLR